MKVGLANDVLALFKRSKDNSQFLDVQVSSFIIMEYVADVNFRIDLIPNTNLTLDKTRKLFLEGLEGRNGDLLPPDSYVVLSSLIVDVPESTTVAVSTVGATTDESTKVTSDASIGSSSTVIITTSHLTTSNSGPSAGTPIDQTTSHSSTSSEPDTTTTTTKMESTTLSTTSSVTQPSTTKLQTTPVSVCSDGLNLCVGSSQCIDPIYFCDLQKNCDNGYDETIEAGCVCKNEEYRCSNGKCIPNDYVCDGYKNDCINNEDEKNCSDVCGIPDCGRDGYFEPFKFNYKPGETVTYKCYPGYTLFGNNTNTCSAAEWTNDPPDCYKICNSLPPPDNGDREPAGQIEHTQTVLFSCNDGYQLFGDQTLSCQDGHYNGSSPIICLETKTFRVESTIDSLDGEEVKWTDNLKNETSTEYVEYSLSLSKSIDTTFINDSNYVGNYILGFKEGSVIAIYTVYFELNSTVNETDVKSHLSKNTDFESVDVIELDINDDCNGFNCTNGGICTDDILEPCECPKNFDGTYCEEESKTEISGGIGVIIIVFIVLGGLLAAVLAALAVYFFVIRIRNRSRKRTSSMSSTAYDNRSREYDVDDDTSAAGRTSNSASLHGSDTSSVCDVTTALYNERMRHLVNVMRKSSYLNEHMRSRIPSEYSSTSQIPHTDFSQQTLKTERQFEATVSMADHEPYRNALRSLTIPRANFAFKYDDDKHNK